MLHPGHPLPPKDTSPFYRAGIVGLGRIASGLEHDPLRPNPCTHAGYYHRDPRARLVAGCDIDPEKRHRFAHDWSLGDAQVYADYREMLEHEALDLVSICAYADDRLAMCREALQRGVRGLWIEKTLGCSLGEAEGIAALLRQHGAVGVVDHPRRARAPYRVIRRMLDQGQWGRLQTIHCHMNAQLLHTGTHAFDMLRFWGGEALRAWAHLESDPTATGEDCGGVGAFELSSGVTAFVSAQRKAFYTFQFDLMFERARVLIGNDILKLYRPAPSRLYSGYEELFEVADMDWSDPHREDLLDDLITSLRDGSEPLCSVDNAVQALRMGLALFESHRRGQCWVNVAEVPDDFRIENR